MLSKRPKREPGEGGPLSIGALSRVTRIPVETLRTWERRYGSPKPVRKPSGHRLYPTASVEHLRRVGRLLSQGHRPGEILGLGVRELDALLSLTETPGPPPDSSPPAIPLEAASLERAIEEMLRAVEELDREALMRELHAGWVRLGPLRFLQDHAGPFMAGIGTAWQSGRLEVRHEHFASACLADFLREVRRPYDRQAKGPRVAAATLPGDQHEGGLLMACVVLAVRGCRIVYLGRDTPVEQVAAAARTSAVEAVVLSVSATVPGPRAGKAVARLREALPRRVPLWVGGAGAPKPAKGVERFETLDALDARLAARTRGASGGLRR